jgi:hypothetical protein
MVLGMSVKSYQPKDWLTSKQLAEYLGISEKTSTARLRRSFRFNLDGMGDLKVNQEQTHLLYDAKSTNFYAPPPGTDPSKLPLVPRNSQIGITKINPDNGWVVRCVARANSGHSYQVRYDSLHQKAVESKPNKLVEIPGRVSDISSYCHIDWLSISQDHHFEIEDVGGGFLLVLGANSIIDRCDQSLVTATAHEDVETIARKYLNHVGSFDSRCFVRCVGGRVDFMGNPARIDRRDNVFGFDMMTSISLINKVLAEYGLPPFTIGERISKIRMQNEMSDKLRYMKHWSGARFTRIDVTSNVSFGDYDSARAFLMWLAGQKIGYQSMKVSPDANTVTYGKASSYIQQICYLKSAEMSAHSKKVVKEVSKQIDKKAFPSTPLNPSIISDDIVDSYFDLLQKDVENQGVVRFELRVLRKFLSQSDYKYLGNFDQSFFTDLFMQRWAPAMRDFEKPQLTELHPKVAGWIARYYAGDDLKRGVSDSTWKRYRKIIKDLGTGIDIARPYMEAGQLQSLKNIEVRPYRVPSFYIEGSRGEQVTGARHYG